MIHPSAFENASTSKKSESESSIDSPQPLHLSDSDLFKSPEGKSNAEQSDSSFYLDASSDDEWKTSFLQEEKKIDSVKIIENKISEETSTDESSEDEWKPTCLKEERKVDPEKIIDIKTSGEPLFGPVQDLPDVSDFDGDEDDEDESMSSSSKNEVFVTPSKPEPDHSKSSPKKLNTGAIRKEIFSNVKPINISRNQDAVKLIRKLVEYFTFHNSLPKKEKEIHKQKLSTELMAVFSQVLDDCCNNIFEEVVQTMELRNIQVSDKKVKTRNVACQTVVTGDVISNTLLPETEGKIKNVEIERKNTLKTDIETVLDLLNEHIVKMSINSQSP